MVRVQSDAVMTPGQLYESFDALRDFKARNNVSSFRVMVGPDVRLALDLLATLNCHFPMSSFALANCVEFMGFKIIPETMVANGVALLDIDA